jgi:hypothetical protein
LPSFPEFLALAFIFLCKTGHDGNHHHIFPFSVNFLAKYVFAIEPNICCGDRAVEGISFISGKWCSKKLTQAGQQEVSIGRFHFFVTFKEFSQPVKKFGSFFHNGKVGCKIGIKNIVKSQLAQSSEPFYRLPVFRVQGRILHPEQLSQQGLFEPLLFLKDH